MGSQRLSITPPPHQCQPSPRSASQPPCNVPPKPALIILTLQISPPPRDAPLHSALRPHLSPVQGGAAHWGSWWGGGPPRARLLSVTCVHAASVCAALCMRVHVGGGQELCMSCVSVTYVCTSPCMSPCVSLCAPLALHFFIPPPELCRLQCAQPDSWVWKGGGEKVCCGWGSPGLCSLPCRSLELGTTARFG